MAMSKANLGLAMLDDASGPIDIFTGEEEQDLDIWTTDDWMVTQACVTTSVASHLLPTLRKFKEVIMVLDKVKEIPGTTSYLNQVSDVVTAKKLATLNIVNASRDVIKKQLRISIDSIKDLTEKVERRSFATELTDEVNHFTRGDISHLTMSIYNITSGLEELTTGTNGFSNVHSLVKEKEDIVIDFVTDPVSFKHTSTLSNLGYKSPGELKVIRDALVETAKYLSEVVEKQIETEEVGEIEEQETNKDDNVIEQETTEVDYEKENEVFKDAIKEYWGLSTSLGNVIAVRKLLNSMLTLS